MGGSSVLAIVLLGVVAATLLALLVVGNLALTGDLAVDLTLVPAPDYADLVPAPDSIIWSEGQESTLLVSTNRDDVELRIDSLDMGIDAVKGSIPHSGELMTLGASVGCQEWAVSKLWADSVTSTGFILRGNVARNNFQDTATVYYRFRFNGGAWRTTGDVDVAGPADDSFAIPSTTSGGVWEVEASSGNTFPTALTRRIVIDQNQETSATDEEVESIVLAKGTAVVLQACSEHDDLTLTLHGNEGVELHRYVVDIGPEPPEPAATATPVPAPVFSEAYQTLRFCPDATDLERSGLLTGAEAVGTVTATGTGTITYSLAPDGESHDFAYFAIDDSTGAVTVSAAGGDDHTGIDGTRLYTVVIRATDDAGRVGEALVAVQLDLSALSPGDDGACS